MTQRRARLPDPPKPDRRRSRALRGRRWALAVVACFGLVALPAAGARADDSAPIVQATIYRAGGGTALDTVTPAQLHANASQCPPYSGATMTEYGRQGPVPVTPDPSNSWTMATILQCLQTPLSLASVTGITVIGGNGEPLTGPGSQLTPADLSSPSDFQNSAETPVITAFGSTDQYDRPWRGGSDLDYLDETQATPITIEVFEGPPLTVRAAASPTTVTLGHSIAFSSTVTGNNGSPLTYTWNFGGGAPNSSQAAPTLQFTTAGVWTVNLEVTDANGGGGGDQVTVTVKPPGSATTPTKTGPTTTGPNKSSGPTPGGRPTNQKKSGTQNSGSHDTYGNGNGKGGTSSQTQTTTTQTTASPTTTTPPSGSSGGSSGPAGGAASTPTTTAGQTTTGHAAPPAPTHRTTPKPTAPPSGTVVHGQLISDVVPLPADQSPLVHPVPASAGGAPAREAPASPSPLPIVAAALAVLALLGLGAQRELGRPRWWPAALRIGH